MTTAIQQDLVTILTPSLEVLGSEVVPAELMRDLLLQAWIPTERVPRPELHVKNDVTFPEQAHLKRADWVLIGSTRIEEEQHGYTYQYKNITVTVPVEIYTGNGRQRLYDLMAEVRRIVYTYQRALTPYQQLYYDGFQEDIEGKHLIWSGTAMMRLTSMIVPIITGIATNYETPASPQAAAPAAGYQPTPADDVREPTEPPPPPENTDSTTF